jgi:hypothetical protein
MARSAENPDRDFSATPSDAPDEMDLRDFLKSNEIADIFDPVVRQRVGELIARMGLVSSRER